MNCLSCASLSGERPLSPGPVIYDGNYWKVEHAYPVSLEGWLVIVLKRHAEALHALQSEEFLELAKLQESAVKTLHQVLHSQKEYAVLFAEKEGFSHVHMHVIARPLDLDPAFKGAGIFSYLNVDASKAIPVTHINELCMKLKAAWNASIL